MDETVTGRTIRLIQEEARAPLLARIERLEAENAQQRADHIAAHRVSMATIRFIEDRLEKAEAALAGKEGELAQQCLAEAERRAREHGFEPRKLQWTWRMDPPDYREDGKWMRECTSAILDALNHEGVVAWDGDAVSCVAQIVQAYARRAALARKEG